MTVHSSRAHPLEHHPSEHHPLEQLSRVERRRWRQQGRRVQRTHEGQQLSLILALAATHAEVRSISVADRPDPLVGAVDLIVGERRIATRMVPAARAALETALASGPLQLVAAGRYGPYWTLTFEGYDGPLVVLAERVLVLGIWGGAAGDVRSPAHQLAG